MPLPINPINFNVNPKKKPLTFNGVSVSAAQIDKALEVIKNFKPKPSTPVKIPTSGTEPPSGEELVEVDLSELKNQFPGDLEQLLEKIEIKNKNLPPNLSYQYVDEILLLPLTNDKEIFYEEPLNTIINYIPIKSEKFVDFIISKYGNNITISKPLPSLDEIAAQTQSQALKDAIEAVKGMGVSPIGYSPAQGCLSVLSRHISPLAENLLKTLTTAVKKEKISALDLCNHLREITTQVLITDYIRANTDEEKNRAKSDYESIAAADNPPYSLKDPRAKTVFEQVLRVHARAKAIRHAFSVLMFDSRRPPTGELPLLARFGADACHEISPLNAKDVNSFPGRGYSLSDLNLEKLFVADPEAKTLKKDPFWMYKEAWPYLSDDFDAASGTNYTFTRGAIIVSSPEDKSCEITVGKDGKKVHYSYVVFNDHFGGANGTHTGSEGFYLVPTEILERKINESKLSYGDYTGFDPKKKDINDSGLNIYDIKKEAYERGLPVLNIGSGSTFAGGLCNAWEPGKKWFFQNELSLVGKPGVMRDAWGHTHKGDIEADIGKMYSGQMTPRMEELFVPFRQAHEEVYRVANSYQNRLDVMLLGYANWQKGFNVGELAQDLSADEYFGDVKEARTEDEGVEDDSFWRSEEAQESEVEDDSWWRGEETQGSEVEDDNFWRGDEHPAEVEHSEERPPRKELSAYDLKNAEQVLGFADSASQIARNPNTLRMLYEAYKWHKGGHEKGIEDRDFYPILSLGPSTDLWDIQPSPFYLDTFDMTLRIGDEIFRFPDESGVKDDYEAEELWFSHIFPYLVKDNAIRFYHRKDLEVYFKLS